MRKIKTMRAFTLLEVIIAIALMGILVSLSAGVVMNVANIWEKSDGSATLDRHIAGLERFLTCLCEEQNTTKIAGSENNSDIVGTTWSVPAGSETDDMYPQFTIKKIYPVIQCGEIPSPQLTAWLFWDKDGLWLISQSPRQKADNADSATYTLLSEFLESVTIHVWDETENAWTAIDTVSESDLTCRAIRLRLKFQQGKREKELTLTLSTVAPGGIPY